jgi:hypothetical protein
LKSSAATSVMSTMPAPDHTAYTIPTGKVRNVSDSS